MINAARAVCSVPPARFASSLLQLPQISTKTSAVRFRTSTAMASEEAKEQKPEKTGNIMSDSFGEGYATRADEEGFGGIYGKNQSIFKTEEEEDSNTVHENHPEFDRTQGSEVKEKEKGRHQSDARE